MAAVDQYLSLWKEHHSLVDSNAPEALNRLRPRAATSLEKHGFPTLKDENYQHTDFEKILSPDYGINIGRVRINVNPAETFRCDVPMLSTSLFLVVNDAFAETSGCRDLLPNGVEIASLAS
ncbi:MAG: arabinogalactan endo-1,4-beta-galactosidase, partial [Muribaculaceae bacterium]|nr:arabinogalactan endo-1,4-beta-galactosidase [Muribaculaceae bacterium]